MKARTTRIVRALTSPVAFFAIFAGAVFDDPESVILGVALLLLEGMRLATDRIVAAINSIDVTATLGLGGPADFQCRFVHDGMRCALVDGHSAPHWYLPEDKS